MQLAAGRPLRIDDAVLASEAATGNRNRAIAYLMLNFGIIDDDVDHTLHQYFSQCSLLVNCHDLAMMAATLANMGNNPVTRECVFDFQYIKDVLTVMFTCGLYDHAGEWAYRVGLPAKSGVGGGLLGVMNRQLGIAVYSPRLDARQQRARHHGVQRTGQPAGSACFRIYQCRLHFHAVIDMTRKPSVNPSPGWIRCRRVVSVTRRANTAAIASL